MNTENKLGTMPINKLIWNMSLPIIASMLVQALYNIVDSIFVSQISEQALTAVSLAFPAQQLMLALSSGTAVGINALTGRALGAGNHKQANAVACNGLFLSVLGAILCCVLCILFSNTFFSAQTQVQEIIDMGNQYLLIVGCCSVGIFVQITFERLLQSTGRSVLSMLIQGVGAIINIILDPIFIFVFDMGVAGAAIATVTGQIVAAILAIILNQKYNKELHLSFRNFRPNLQIIGNIYAIGIPSVIMLAIGSVMTFLMNKILITYHTAKETAATAFGIYFKLNSFIFMPLFGLNNGSISILAYNYGARKRHRMVSTIKSVCLYALCIMLVGVLLFQALPHPLLRMFDATDTMLAVGTPALRIISISFPFSAICIAISGAFQATGKSIYSMIVSMLRQLVVLIPAAFVLARIGQNIGNSNLVWWSYPLAETVALIIILFFYARLRRKVLNQLPENGETEN